MESMDVEFTSQERDKVPIVPLVPIDLDSNGYPMAKRVRFAEPDKTEGNITCDDTWKIVQMYDREYGSVRNQIEQYDHLINVELQNMIDSVQEIVQENENNNHTHKIKLGKIYITKPTVNEPDNKVDNIMKQENLIISNNVSFITPHAARLRQITFSTKMYLDIQENEYDDRGTLVNEKEYPRVIIGELPVMLKSSICPLSEMTHDQLIAIKEDPEDLGGYFIINGNEKMLIAQEHVEPNYVLVFSKPYTKNRTLYTAEIRAVSESGFKVPGVLKIRYKVKNNMSEAVQVILPYIRQPIPVTVLFKALNVESDGDIVYKVFPTSQDRAKANILKPTLEEVVTIKVGDENVPIKTRADALAYIGSKMHKDKKDPLSVATNLINNEIFPHIGTDVNCLNEKSVFLGYMVNKLIKVSVGEERPDERDHYGRKRIDTTYSLLITLFNQIIPKFIKDFKIQMQRIIKAKKTLDLARCVRPKIITQSLKYSISSGNWVASKLMKPRTGVSGPLVRLNPLSMYSGLKRLNTPVGREGKLAKPRQLNETHWGNCCVAETPEGSSVSYLSFGYFSFVLN